MCHFMIIIHFLLKHFKVKTYKDSVFMLIIKLILIIIKSLVQNLQYMQHPNTVHTAGYIPWIALSQLHEVHIL